MKSENFSLIANLTIAKIFEVPLKSLTNLKICSYLFLTQAYSSYVNVLSHVRHSN